MAVKVSNERINEMIGVDDAYKAPDRLMAVLRNKDEREAMFREFLEAFVGDVTYDWFTDYFQDEHADRKTKKQDFTPRSIGGLLAALTGDTTQGDGNFYEGAAGTGGLAIARWNADRYQHSPFDYRPSWYFYVLEELSDRAIPFLLFNVMIRGMNAVVVHCDVLSREAKAVYFVQNDSDDHMRFSSLNILPQTDEVANSGVYVPLKWKDGVTITPHIESPPLAELGFITNPSERGSKSLETLFIERLAGASGGVTQACGVCAKVFTEKDGAFDYSPEHGDVCEACSVVEAE